MGPDEVDPATLGDILNTMVAAGVSNEALGKFALLYRNKRLAALPAPVMEMGPVLEAFATTVAEKLRGGAIHATRAPEAESKSSTGSRIIRMKVAGKQTSVSVSKDLFDKAVVAFGNEAAVSSIAKQLASQAPGNTPRSAYVQAQLLQAIASAQTPRSGGSGAVH